MNIGRDDKSYALLILDASRYLNQAATYLNTIISKDDTGNLIVTRASLKGLSMQVTRLSKNGCDMIEIQKIINRVQKLIDQLPPIPQVMQYAELAKENLIKAIAYC
ncbi:hypothetical protein Calag_0772 [Caldisphaera lagunensis DSM 15908]|uniref:Uncharacterized protein n=1 Tax=Caldisphaera lagunensis (strain DSM 15908 / JCM 11604 / ANMR 0165 / IC-154) TaxID=1056495 RepID=L0ABU0_CALLD|nr:hypothetical protein [Caldisphaera lagunensis]AFZ70515.1 hypothetical protein Calag_0772 [Caldisphaera lagunensis DSM 15908]